MIVVNFLNERNEADKRVHALLTEKFNLFDGIFGASDEVLGSIESGSTSRSVFLAIYQDCRTPEAIAKAFDELQNSSMSRYAAVWTTPAAHFWSIR